MNLIQCDADCIYQHDGYCALETPAVITNNTKEGCVHFIRTAGKNYPPTGVSQRPPQTHL